MPPGDKVVSPRKKKIELGVEVTRISGSEKRAGLIKVRRLSEETPGSRQKPTRKKKKGRGGRGRKKKNADMRRRYTIVCWKRNRF